LGIGYDWVQTRGLKEYELTNQLGNVLATVTDKKLGHSSNDSTVDYYTPDIVSAQDYYPFGMLQPGRQLNEGKYRYGFNGKENDNEVKGEANLQDYGMRMYDPRLGRFLSIDPLTKTYPWYSPYQFAGNKPIWATDIDGLEENTSSTHVNHPPVLGIRQTFAGTINITDATTQTVHGTFSGNYTQLKKADATGMAPAIVNHLVGSNVGNSASTLNITMTGSRSQISKTWKGTDIKYFTQYSYSLTGNNTVEKGTFELQTAQIQASERAWSPLTFLLLNKVVSSIVINAVAARMAASATANGTIVTEEMTTLYRSISKGEAESITNSGKLSLGEGMEAKQFWQTKEGLEAWNKTALAGEYNLEITVPKSAIGNGKTFNTAVQVDEFIGPNVTIDRAEMEAANKSIQSYKITPITKQ
jgi:RHS repeat-associated protein